MTANTDQVQMFLKDETANTVSSAWVDAEQVPAHREVGWVLEDPAFLPDDYSAAVDQRGLVRVVSNFGGTSKFVSPDDVAWYEQNGWTAAHRIADDSLRFVPPKPAPKPARSVPVTTGPQRVQSETTGR